VIQFKSRYLTDLHSNKICWETLNLRTGLPDYKNTEKFIFDESGNEILEARYNSDGSLDHIIYKVSELNEEDWEYYKSSDCSKLQKKFKTNLEYYLTAKLEPLINI